MIHSYVGRESSIFFGERNGNLKPQKHISPALVKYVEFRHLFTYIIPGNRVIILPAIRKESIRAGNFVVKAVEVNAGVHAAVQYFDAAAVVAELLFGENEHLVRYKARLLKVLFFHAGAEIVGQNLRKSAAQKLLLLALPLGELAAGDD